MSNECRDFFSLPSSQGEKVFVTYDLDKQLRLYRCGMNLHPPDSSLALYIAERGESAIPALLDKLDAETDELFQYSIVRIFALMSLKGQLRNRSDVIDRIRQVVRKMKIPTFREMAQEELNKIEQKSFG
jgi:hypothetical protein